MGTNDAWGYPDLMTDSRPIGFWLRLVDNLINEQFSKTLDEHGVTRLQWQLLNVLASGPKSVIELDSSVRPFLVASGDESSAEHLTELIESGWVDAMETGYELTERGRGARDRLSNVVAGQRTEMAAGLTEDEYTTTVRTLERVARNLGWSDET
jgi:DNA-binding MarR family transcriptional regulator